MESGKITLKHPITIKSNNNGIDVQITSLTIGRMKVKHLKLLPKSAIIPDKKGNMNVAPQDMIPLIAGLTNLSEDEVGEIDIEDLEAVSNKITEIVGESHSLKAAGKRQ